MKTRTRCWKCQELGHIERDCPSSRPSTRPDPSRPKANFFASFGGGSSTEHFMTMHVWATAELFVGVQMAGHEALVDTAAEDGVIGKKSLDRLTFALEKFGLRPFPVANAVAVQCSGIGGKSTVLGQVDVPVGLAGINGLLRLTVLDDTDTFTVPALLPINM